MLDQITPLILTRDEETNIGRTLAQLAWAAEVIVVDSFSSDRTVEIAQSFPNVRLLQRTFDQHARQWTFGLNQVSTDWVLALDADHFVPDAFVNELRSLTIRDGVRGFRAPFHYAVNGKLLRASLYPPRIVLIQKAHASFYQDGHTQRILVDGEIGELHASLIHDDRKDFTRFVARQRVYMRQEADKLRQADPRSLSLAGRIRKLIVVAPVAVLLQTLFVRGLILDGIPGLRYTWERFIAELILSREMLRRR